MRSPLTFLAEPSDGRRSATVHPKPGVYQAFCVESVNRICEVLERPASLTYPVRNGTRGLGGRSVSGSSRSATSTTEHAFLAA